MNVSLGVLLASLNLQDKKNIQEITHQTKGNLSPLTQEAPQKTIFEILQSLTKGLADASISKESVLAVLAQSGIAKSMQNAHLELRTILDLLKKDPSLDRFLQPLEKALLHAGSIDASKLKNQLSSFGIFTDSSLEKSLQNFNLKSLLQEMSQELKSNPSAAAKEMLWHVNKALIQIDYYQLLSFASTTNTSYLPFAWNGLLQGQIAIKKLKEKRFFCEINLVLKEYGKIDLLLMLFDDIHVNISIFAKKKEFLQLFKSEAQTLKKGITSLGLHVASLQFFDAQRDAQIKKEKRIFADANQMGAGLNITI